MESSTFPLNWWRTMLNTVANQMPLRDCQVINPFGFEIIENITFLKKNLNRFYIYFGNNSELEKNIEFEYQFYEILLRNIKSQNENLYNRIGVVVFENDERKILLKNNFDDELILFNIEHRVFKQNLLLDYAEYIASCLEQFYFGTLPELERFSQKKRVRNRVYQLYLILEYATEYLNIEHTEKEIYVLKSLHTLYKPQIKHYFEDVILEKSTFEDTFFLQTILKRCEKIYTKAYLNAQQFKPVSIKSYNSNHKINTEIPKLYYENITGKIIETYTNYGKNITYSSELEFR